MYVPHAAVIIPRARVQSVRSAEGLTAISCLIVSGREQPVESLDVSTIKAYGARDKRVITVYGFRGSDRLLFSLLVFSPKPETLNWKLLSAISWQRSDLSPLNLSFCSSGIFLSDPVGDSWGFWGILLWILSFDLLIS